MHMCMLPIHMQLGGDLAWPIGSELDDDTVLLHPTLYIHHLAYR